MFWKAIPGATRVNSAAVYPIPGRAEGGGTVVRAGGMGQLNWARCAIGKGDSYTGHPAAGPQEVFRGPPRGKPMQHALNMRE